MHYNWLSLKLFNNIFLNKKLTNCLFPLAFFGRRDESRFGAVEKLLAQITDLTGKASVAEGSKFYCPQTKLREGNVFTPVCDSVQGGVSQHAMGRGCTMGSCGLSKNAVKTKTKFRIRSKRWPKSQVFKCTRTILFRKNISEMYSEKQGSKWVKEHGVLDPENIVLIPRFMVNNWNINLLRIEAKYKMKCKIQCKHFHMLLTQKFLFHLLIKHLGVRTMYLWSETS